MPDPVSYTGATPRYALPLLFPGQSQKEFFVNGALALTDALLHAACEGEASEPPASPAEGQSWLIAAGTTGEWAGRDQSLAAFRAGTWLYVAPNEGMRVFDRSTGQLLIYRGGNWQRPASPAQPTGGTTVDAEARTAIAELIAALIAAGVLPAM